MEPNVLIKHYKRGALFETREVHNSWTNFGRLFLRNRVSYYPVNSESRRVKYMSLGIGGRAQSYLATLPPISTTHSPGNDPRATAGNTYDDRDLEGSGDGTIPPVSTLEMPVRVSGAEEDYPDAILSGTSTWYIQSPDLFITQLSTRRGLAVHGLVDATAGSYIFGSYVNMPICEAGLHLEDIDINQPYQPLVAYVNFGTLLLTDASQLEIIWQVRVAT